MEFTATGKYTRVSPRKLALLARSVKDVTPLAAVVRLTHINKAGAQPLQKVINSVLANAKAQNANVNELKFKHIQVTPGSALKRFRAVSRGMAHSYKKRMSHIRVILTDDGPKKAANVGVKKKSEIQISKSETNIEKGESLKNV